MPRVHSRTKRRGGKTYTCDKCREPIEPQQRYYTSSFRYGGTRTRHETCGYPRPSELTQSRLSEVYAAMETLQDNADTWETEEDAQQAAQDAADVVREVVEAYTEAAEHFGGQGENQERAEQLESFADDLESWQPPYLADYTEEGEEEPDLHAWREAAASEVPECPL